MKELFVYIYETCVITEVSLLAWWVNSEDEFKITTIGETAGTFLSLEGIPVTPEKVVSDINLGELNDVAGILFPGGIEIVGSEKTFELVRTLKSQNKLIGGICAGPTFLAMAGALNDVGFTTTRSPEFFTEKKIPDPFPWGKKLEKRVVRDRNVVTATGAAFTEFADECFGFLDLYLGEEDRKSLLNDFTPRWKY